VSAALVKKKENMKLEPRLIFNELGSDSAQDRTIVGGNSTGIANLNSVRYEWASKLVTIMLNNFWIPEKVSLSGSKVTLKELTEKEEEATKNTLSFLIALDSMQTAALPRLASYVTAPEVSAIYTIQEFQELIHSKSYQYILQELYPSLSREEIYNRWRTNPVLLKRNKLISRLYQDFIDNPTKESFKKALVADFILEGIYFYHGFQFFYLLQARTKLVEVASMIKYIENDEVTHLSFMVYQIKELFDLSKDSDDSRMIREAVMEAVDQEIEYGHTTYGDWILGMSFQSTEQYVKWLANQRAKLVGIPVIYPGFDRNPYAHLDAKKRENFFEKSAVTEYSNAAAVSGWDDF
jgi:ribonucleoside-diphosphate reductase beta chain